MIKSAWVCYFAVLDTYKAKELNLGVRVGWQVSQELPEAENGSSSVPAPSSEWIDSKMAIHRGT